MLLVILKKFHKRYLIYIILLNSILMKKNRIYFAYAVLASVILITYVYLDLSFRDQYEDWMNTPFSTVSPKLFKEPIAKFSIVKTVNLSEEELIDVFTNISDYPKILPKNVLNTNIINVTDEKIFTDHGEIAVRKTIFEIEVIEKGIGSKFQVSQTIEGKNLTELPLRHLVEVLTGDAKGTIVEQQFSLDNLQRLQVTNGIELRLHGILTPFVFLPEYNLKHAANTILDSFIDYKKIKSENQRIIDDLYREILFRPADPDGLQYFASQLESGKITPQEIKTLLLESEEKKYLLSPTELKPLDELSIESKNIVDDLYREILFRPADPDGLQYYASQLESGKLTIDEIRTILANSIEAKSME